LEVLSVNDRQGRVRVALDNPLTPDGTVSFAIHHPCTALDKWRLLPLVDEGDLVTGALLTFF
jgi:D-serine deaminase-like pyridoxal phosphate-dependent protein